MRMTCFAEHGGGDRDFEFRVGPTTGPWDITGFGDRLWQNVGAILGIALGQAPEQLRRTAAASTASRTTT